MQFQFFGVIEQVQLFKQLWRLFDRRMDRQLRWLQHARLGQCLGVAVPGDVFSLDQDDNGIAAFVDPTSPDGHDVLKVSYKAHSAARFGGASCPLPDGAVLSERGNF